MSIRVMFTKRYPGRFEGVYVRDDGLIAIIHFREGERCQQGMWWATLDYMVKPSGYGISEENLLAVRDDIATYGKLNEIKYAIKLKLEVF